MPSLMAILGVDISRFQRGMEDAKSVARAGGGNIARELATSIGSAFTGTAILSSASRFVESLANEAKEIDYGSQKLDVSVERFQALKYAAETTGTSIDTVTAAYRNIAKSAIEAESGNAEAIDSLKAIGVQVDDIKSKSPDQIFSEISKSVEGAKLSTEQLVALNKVLGKTYQDLTPGLQRGAFANARDPFADDASDVKSNKRFSDDMQVIRGGVRKILDNALSPAANEGGVISRVIKANADAIRFLWKVKPVNEGAPVDMKSQAKVEGMSTQERERIETRIATLKKKLAEEQRQSDLASMTTAERIAFIDRERAELRKKMATGTDSQKLEAALAFEKLGQDRTALVKSAEKEDKLQITGNRNELQKIGAYSAMQDTTITIQKSSNEELKKIRRVLEDQSRNANNGWGTSY